MSTVKAGQAATWPAIEIVEEAIMADDEFFVVKQASLAVYTGIIAST